MREKEKAAPGAPNTEDSSGQILFDGFSLEGDFITQPGTDQAGIERYLLHGHDNALSVEALRIVTGLHPRKITQAVQDARRRGVAVLSSSHPGGYYLAETEDEKQRFVCSLRHRAKETAFTLRCLERAQVEE